MIVGIGVDIVDVARLAAAIERTPNLVARVFTDGERRCTQRPAGECHHRHAVVASLAARFAAKEATAKALGSPSGLRWRDAEVVADPGGRPRLVVRDTVAAVAVRLGVTGWHVSLSHDRGAAVAVVVAEGGVAGAGAAVALTHSREDGDHAGGSWRR